MPSDNDTSSEGFNWEEIKNSEGVDPEENTEEDEEGESTDENVQYNDPEMNKKMSEVTMAEQLRETYNLTITIPKFFKGLHTNQFFFMDITNDFYEANYGTIIQAIADRKFARFAGFQKGRFFVEKMVEKGGIDGWTTEITLNPIPPSLATWSKMQQEATKALISAIYDETSMGGGGGLTSVQGSECDETLGIATTSYEINESSKNKIGNSSSNYATDTAGMDAKTAIMDIYNRFSYSSYQNNRTCPQQMWNKDGTISGNCADISRLCMCVGQVHGLNIGIHHMSGHYYNLIEYNGQVYRFDCCCKSSGKYGGEQTNTLLSKFGGPW